MSKLTKELIDQLGDAVEKADTLPALVEKAADSEQAALALDGVARLLATHKGDLTPEIVADVVKAAGLELPEAEGPSLEAKNASELVAALKKAGVSKDAVAEVEAAIEKATEKAELEKADLSPAAKAALKKAEDATAAAQKKADEAIAKADAERDARLDKEFVAKAEAFDSLPTKADDLGPILKEASEKLPKESYEALETLLKATNEGIEKGELFSTAGADGVTEPGADAFAQLKQKAEEIRKSDSSLTPEQALEKAGDENPELQAAYLAEVRR
jgi:hypothetical protein